LEETMVTKDDDDSVLAFDVVAACEETTGGIGIRNGLPWHIPGDLEAFKALTMGCAVIMGRNTWDSINSSMRRRGMGLPGRVNVVISNSMAASRSHQSAEGGGPIVVRDLEAALKVVGQNMGMRTTKRAFVIGGSQVYRDALRHPGCRRIYLTLVRYRDKVPEFDAFFPLDILRQRYAQVNKGNEFFHNIINNNNKNTDTSTSNTDLPALESYRMTLWESF
jgi:dihydrofolate reductase